MPGSDPALDGVRVDANARTRDAEAAYIASVRAQRDAQGSLRAAEQTRRDLGRQASDAAQVVEADRAGLAAAQDRLAGERAQLDRLRSVEALRRVAFRTERDGLRRLAAAVVAASATDPYDVFTATKDPTDSSRRQVVKLRSIDQQTARVEGRQKEWAGAQDERRQKTDALSAATSAVDAAGRKLDGSIRAYERLVQQQKATDDEIVRRHGAVDAAAVRVTDAGNGRRAARLTAPVSRVDFPLVALDAYWRAARSAPCPIPWWLLAGVGHTETNHGADDGSDLDASGTASVRIRGIVLDGAFPGTAAIRDTDGGILDDDPVWERAVGPMQFIPGTWKRWATDGNHDGVADPHNLYDAAGAAARYLCASRLPFTNELGLRGALFSYNASAPYADEVLSAGQRYRSTLGLPDVAPKAPPLNPRRRGA